MLTFFKRLGYGAAVLILLALFALLLDPVGLLSLGKNLGYVFVAVLVAWILIVVANRTGVTGKYFTLHKWLDDIDGRRVEDSKGEPTGAPIVDPHANAKAIVIVGILLACAVVVSRFVG